MPAATPTPNFSTARPDRSARAGSDLRRLAGARTPRSLVFGALLLAAACTSAPKDADSADQATGETAADATGPDASADGDALATLHAVLGSGGIRTPELPEGAYLGQGATLRAGQTLEVPPGAMAELQLKSGATLRLNENTQLRMPASASDWRFRLDRGELVALVPVGQGPIGVEVSDDEWLEVHSGEARTLARPGERAHDVVYGVSRLYRGADVIALGPGSHVDSARADVTAPRAKGTETIVAEVSLAPLEATEWSRQFETAGRMLDAVPAGVGSLTARRAGSSVQRQTLELVDHKVNVAISGRIAHTEIEQTFFNTAPAVLEGTYRFPLPTDASISGLDLLVGNRWMEAAMVEKSRAQRIFKSIVDATIPRDPALLHWEQGNIFKLKIFPIPGRGERSIRLSYTQVLDSVGDTLRYRYPMGGASGGVAGDAIGNFEFTVTVDRRDLPPGSEEALVSPMLALDRSQQGDRIQLHTRKHNFRPTHDLGVDIPLPTEERRLHAETHLDRDGQAYFMVAMTPTLEGLRARASDRPVDVVFVIDRSHSTTPELWAVARSLVGALSESLGDRDRVAALACDSACDESPGGLAPRSREQLAALDSFLEGQQLAGASDLGGMLREGARTLQAAPSAAPGGGPERERVVVYLGDGNPTAGELRADALLTQLAGDFGPGGAQLQLVALGARSDLLVLEALARELGGDLVQADARDDFGGLVRELRARAAIPSVRDLELDLPDGMVQVHPKRLAAIRPGETITLTGKLSQPVRGDVTLRARGPDGARVEERFNVQLEAAVDGTSGRHAHLPRTWAREEIDFLTATQGDAGKRDIVALSTEYTVLSRYTALIALENDAMYREFNVVRKRGRKDTWDGRLENRDSAAPSTIAPTETASSASPSVPLGGAPLPDASPPPPAREAKSEEAEPEEAEASADEAAEKLDAKSFDEGGASRDPAPPPSAKDDAPSFSPPRLEDADNDASGDDEADALDRFEVELGEDFEGEPQAPATTKAPAPKSTKKMKKKASSGSAKPSAPSRDGSLSNPFDSGWGPGGSSGGGSSSGWAGGKKKWRPRRPQLVASRASAPSSRTRDRVDDLRRRRDAAPTNRSAHLQLVRAAARAGAPETLQFAQAWSKADPDYAPAMIALADQLAAHGDTLAPRVYGSAVELRPFDRTLQDRVASGYESKGDLERACAHRRALTSIAPTRGDYHAELARCLARVGQLDDAREAARRGLEKATRDQSKLRSLERQLSQVVVDRSALEGGDRLHSGPQLKAKLTWNGAADLDIALVDSRGRRLSAMYPKSVRVREEDGEETLTIAKVSSKVFVEVSRHDQGAAPVTARLTVTAGGRSRSFDITVGRDSQRVAAVDWKLR